MRNVKITALIMSTFLGALVHASQQQTSKQDAMDTSSSSKAATQLTPSATSCAEACVKTDIIPGKLFKLSPLGKYAILNKTDKSFTLYSFTHGSKKDFNFKYSLRSDCLGLGENGVAFSPTAKYLCVFEMRPLTEESVRNPSNPHYHDEQTGAFQNHKCTHISIYETNSGKKLIGPIFCNQYSFNKPERNVIVQTISDIGEETRVFDLRFVKELTHVIKLSYVNDPSGGISDDGRYFWTISRDENETHYRSENKRISVYDLHDLPFRSGRESTKSKYEFLGTKLEFSPLGKYLWVCYNSPSSSKEPDIKRVQVCDINGKTIIDERSYGNNISCKFNTDETLCWIKYDDFILKFSLPDGQRILHGRHDDALHGRGKFLVTYPGAAAYKGGKEILPKANKVYTVIYDWDNLNIVDGPLDGDYVTNNNNDQHKLIYQYNRRRKEGNDDVFDTQEYYLPYVPEYECFFGQAGTVIIPVPDQSDKKRNACRLLIKNSCIFIQFEDYLFVQQQNKVIGYHVPTLVAKHYEIINAKAGNIYGHTQEQLTLSPNFLDENKIFECVGELKDVYHNCLYVQQGDNLLIYHFESHPSRVQKQRVQANTSSSSSSSSSHSSGSSFSSSSAAASTGASTASSSSSSSSSSWQPSGARSKK